MKILPKTPATNNDGLGRGMEFAILVLLFLGIGYGCDRLFDTKPVFMIIWFALAVVGQFVSMWYQYNGAMTRLEAERRDKLVSRHDTAARHTGTATDSVVAS